MSEEYDKLIENLNSVKFKYFDDNIKLGDALCSQIHFMLNTEKKQKWYMSCIKIIFKTFVSKYRLISIGNKNETNTICFMSVLGNRDDHRNNFLKFTTLFKNVYLYYMGKHHFLLTRIFKIIYVFSWNKVIKKLIKNIDDRLFVLENIYNAYLVSNEFKCAVSKINVKNIIVYCDHSLEDSLIVQSLFNDYNTITLQHGIYAHYYSSWLKYSKAKYFFAYSQFTLDEAKIIDNKCNNLIITGPLFAINYKPKSFDKNSNICKVAFFIDGGNKSTYDYKILTKLNDFTKKINVNFCARPHPGKGDDFYIDFCKKERIELCSSKESIIDFIEKNDLFILVNTSSLGDVLLRGKKVLILNDKENPTIFNKYDELLFNSFDEFYERVKNINSDSYVNTLYNVRNYYFNENNIVNNNYLNAFNSIKISI